VLQKTITGIFVMALIAFGQTNSCQGGASTAIYPPAPQAFEELKNYVGLNDTQIEQLRKVLEEKSAQTQELYKKVQEKQVELNQLLQLGSRDVSRIGQLMLDIHILSTQPPAPTDQWRQRALAILTLDQRMKLAPLDQALKLSSTAYEAVTLNLIDPPPPTRPIILDLPVPAGLGFPIRVPGTIPTLPAPGTPIPLPTPIAVGQAGAALRPWRRI
jgi:hypothetical protein